MRSEAERQCIRIARRPFSLFQTAHIQSALRNGIWHAVLGLPGGSSGSGLVVATRDDSVPPSVLAYPLRFGSLLGRHFRLVLRHQDQLHQLELLHVAAAGITVRFLDNPAMNFDTAHGELLLAILAATAAFERRLILTRTAEGREIAKQKGVKFGRPAVVSKELKARIEALRSEGTLTARQIGERLGVSRRTIYRKN